MNLRLRWLAAIYAQNSKLVTLNDPDDSRRMEGLVKQDDRLHPGTAAKQI